MGVFAGHPASKHCCCGLSSKAWLVLAALWSTFLFAGIIFGYSAFELILKREGLYQSIDAAGHVHFDTGSLNLIISVAIAISALGATPIGWSADWLGPRITVRIGTQAEPATTSHTLLPPQIAIAGVLQTCGSLCIAFAAPGRLWLLNLGFGCLAYAGARHVACCLRSIYHSKPPHRKFCAHLRLQTRRGLPKVHFSHLGWVRACAWLVPAKSHLPPSRLLSQHVQSV